MQMKITDEAVSKLKAISNPSKPYLLLEYNTDDCMCSIDGTPIVRFVKEKRSGDQEVKANEFQVIVADGDRMFFEEELILEHNNHGFRLNSPAGMINPIISEHAVKEGFSGEQRM